MKQLASHTRLTIASTVLVASLALAGSAFAQASTSPNNGSSVAPPAASSPNGRAGQRAQEGVTQGNGQVGNGQVNSNRPNSNQPCTPGSTTSANSTTQTCRDPNTGMKETLPNAKGNSNHN
jgi:hypothetical protein